MQAKLPDTRGVLQGQWRQVAVVLKLQRKHITAADVFSGDRRDIRARAALELPTPDATLVRRTLGAIASSPCTSAEAAAVIASAAAHAEVAR